MWAKLVMPEFWAGKTALPGADNDMPKTTPTGDTWTLKLPSISLYGPNVSAFYSYLKVS